MDHFEVVRSEPRDRRVLPGVSSWGLILLILVAWAIPVGADNANLSWAKRAGGGTTDEGSAIAADELGNTYITGYFKLTATFGAGDPSPVQLTALGQDVFVAKYGPGGALLWVRQARSQAGWGSGIGLDAAGNCYVFGHFGPTITFASGTPQQVSFNALANDLFLAKYDKDGNFLWAKQTQGSNSETANGIAVDQAGNSFVTGRYGSNPVTFGAGESNQTALPGLGRNNGEDVFIAKYNPNGQLVWAKSAGGATGNGGMGIDIDDSGNAYVVGRYSGTATFGPGEVHETVLKGPLGSNYEIFVAKYLSDGTLAWVRSGLGQAEHDEGTAIAVDKDGNSYATGTFRSRAPFAGELNQTQLDEGGSADIFVVKHDKDGNQQWVKMMVGPADEVSTGIAVGSDGSSYVTAHGFHLVVGAEEDHETSLNGEGQGDVFIAKLDTQGGLLWARSDGGIGDDRAMGIAVDKTGGIHVVGRFGQTAVFGEGQPTRASLTSAGATDTFIARYQVKVDALQPARFVNYSLLFNGNPQLRFSGSAQKTYDIFRATTLTSPSWTAVGTVLTDGSGNGSFEDQDEDLTFPAYYRVDGK
ncbi:MAG: SBBP repeat-containing protein [Verrucomicrobiales bacterium]|nr:SBBP repeat-containing protein [Verrucomicrobiales bacterium]